MPGNPQNLAAPAPPHWERYAVWLLLGLFVAIGLNNIGNHAYAGQDFPLHVGSTTRLLAHPGEWFSQDFTNRPLIYWIALDGMWLTQDRATFEFAAAVFVLLNAGALWLLYDCSRRCIASPALRVASLAFVAMLPVTLTTSVVFAGDAMVQPPFALLAWSLIRWAEVSSPRSALKFATLAGFASLIGNLAKFTFIGVPVVVLSLVLLLWQWRRVSIRHVAMILVLGVAVPLLAGALLHRRATAQLQHKAAWHAFDWRGTGELTWRSLLGLRTTDARIFAAPTYWDRTGENGRTTMPMLEANGFSYPALLHLATFTDVLDFGHGGFTAVVYQKSLPRPAPQQRFARWSVRTGLIFSCIGIMAVLAVWWHIGRGVLEPATAPATAVVVWAALALAWQLALMLPLPFIQHAYDWGYWLPRLVLPALWGFSLGLFWMLDVWLGHRRRLANLILGVTLLQSGLHVGSVWF